MEFGGNGEWCMVGIRNKGLYDKKERWFESEYCI